MLTSRGSHERQKILGAFNVRGSSLLWANDRFLFVLMKDRAVVAKLHGEFDDPRVYIDPSPQAMFIFGYVPLRLASRVPFIRRRLDRAGRRISDRKRRILSATSIDEILKT